MSKTQVSCPNCRQPVVVDVEQLFDVNVDPSAKSRLLSGAVNLIRCPYCGYQGNVATPIVYHDPEKELLLTFVPAELGLPRNEQERLIGALINQVISKLPQEKRKGYLLSPQSTLTMQGLVERVLEKDGITREMIQAQQQKLNLLQRLANASDESVLAEIARQEDASIDAEFFSLLNRLMEVALMNGDRNSANQLSNLQKRLLPMTTYGRQVQAQSKEIETAISDLRALGRELNREQLLNLIIQAPNEIRLSALVSLARPALDYQFFQMLSERIDAADAESRSRLVELRAQLLEMTQEIDRQMEEHRQQTRKLIETILETEDIEGAMSQVFSAIDETFVQELQSMLNEARTRGDLDRSGKLQEMLDVLRQASAPPEMALLEEYLDLPGDPDRRQFLESHAEEITPEFMDLLANIMVQVQSGDDKEFANHVMAANRQALRFSMQRNLNAES
jgi:hypothetical protein